MNASRGGKSADGYDPLGKFLEKAEQPGGDAEDAEPVKAEHPESVESQNQVWQEIRAVGRVNKAKEFRLILAAITPRVIATRSLVCVNLVVFALMVLCGVDLISPTVESLRSWGANYGPDTLNGQWWRLFTCTFVHIGILHLAFNMWVLFSLGELVERFVGNMGLVTLYLVCGCFGSLASVLWDPFVTSAGASGAIFGLAGALLGFLVHCKKTIPPEILADFRNSGLAFLGFNLLYGLKVGHIDIAAHLGGLAAGFVCGIIMGQPITLDAPGRRRALNLFTIGIAAAAMVVAILLSPAAPPDFAKEFQQFAETESWVMERYDAAARKHKSGEINDDEFAAVIERDVLHDWKEASRRLRAAQRYPADLKDILAELREYIGLRTESWALQVEGLREHNARKVAEATEKFAAASQFIKEISK